MLGALLDQVRNAINQHHDERQGNMDRDSLIGNIESLFNQHEAANNQNYGGNVLPASQDPYGDPAYGNQGRGNVLPASQDPYGDPAYAGRQGGVLPASQDPYGDPADQR